MSNKELKYVWLVHAYNLLGNIEFIGFFRSKKLATESKKRFIEAKNSIKLLNKEMPPDEWEVIIGHYELDKFLIHQGKL